MEKLEKYARVFTSIIIVSIIMVTILNKGTTIYNNIGSMISITTNEVDPYDTEYIYIENIPSTADPVVLKEGINGLDYTYDGLNYIHLSDKSTEIVQKGSGKPGEFTGRMTGYGPDCPGCSTIGNVACLTKEGKRHSLTNDGLYYEDSIYGKVRILAADNSAFPCGTIVKVDNGTLKEFYGIVLDSGYTMRKAWQEGTVWMDLAFSSQKEAKTGGATSSKTNYSVQRWGW